MSKVSDWLVYAENDLKTAKAALAEGITNTSCLHSHQVAEKSLKAVLLEKERTVPKVHDLLFLLEKAAKHVEGLSQFKEACRFLNQFYLPMRYPDALPGSLEDMLPTIKDCKKAISFGEEIF